MTITSPPSVSMYELTLAPCRNRARPSSTATCTPLPSWLSITRVFARRYNRGDVGASPSATIAPRRSAFSSRTCVNDAPWISGIHAPVEDSFAVSSPRTVIAVTGSFIALRSAATAIMPFPGATSSCGRFAGAPQENSTVDARMAPWIFITLLP